MEKTEIATDGRCPMRRSLMLLIVGETTRRASRTRAMRAPASPVLRILDPRLALAIFAAMSARQGIDRR